MESQSTDPQYMSSNPMHQGWVYLSRNQRSVRGVHL